MRFGCWLLTQQPAASTGPRGGTCWLKLGTAACLGGVPMGTARTGGLPMTGEDERRGSARSEGSLSSSRACGGLWGRA